MPPLKSMTNRRPPNGRRQRNECERVQAHLGPTAWVAVHGEITLLLV